MRYIYRSFTIAYVALLAPVVWLKASLGRPLDRERFGLGLPHRWRAKSPIWLVASSVGEVTLALKLIARLRANTDRPLLLTVTTRTGRAHAQAASMPPDVISFHPFDTVGSVQRFLAHFQPAAILLIETELWPTLMECAFERQIPVAQISGRISDHSLQRYRALRPLFAPLLERLEACIMQSDEDAFRVAALGARPDRIEVLGSAKEEYHPPAAEISAEAAERLSAWQAERVFVCGSTRPGEEIALLRVCETAWRKHPTLRLILVPRHLDRIPEIKLALQGRNAAFRLWSELSLTREDRILVVDAMGYLSALYHRAELAFVGGTLVPIGGHNLLEPALAGCPVIYGPHFFQQRRGHRLLQQFGLGHAVDNEAQLEETLSRLLQEGDLRTNCAPSVAVLREHSAHILDEYSARILKLLDKPADTIADGITALR